MKIRLNVVSALAQAQCLVLALWSVLHTCSSFNLDGRPGAYAKFPAWEPCLNGSFSFEFKTDSPNALLVYLDHGKFKFFELKMISGSLRLRVNLAEGTVIMRVGADLDDSQWHKVEVRQDNERTILSVDGVPHSRTAPGSVSELNDPSTNREVLMFFGGLPQEYDNQLLVLALPSVVFEPRFKGSIRNLFFRDCGAEPHRPEMIDSFGLRSMEVDLCERGNPCLNNGVCLTTDEGLLCDCAKTEYEGDRCDIEKVPSDATFLGAQYLSYNLSSGGDVLDSNKDQVSLDFRTKQPDGLLFYTGNRKDYLNLALKDGVIVLTVNLGTGSYEEVVPREGSPRLDDNRWHHVLVRREAREISLVVNGIYRGSGSTTGRYTRLSSKLLYVAGSPHSDTLPGSRVRANFKGCMRKVRYKADNVELDLTELARSQHPLLKVNGEVIYDKCQELSESRPITFTTPQSYLTVPTWDQAQDKGSIAFQFQTVEQNGMVLYTTGVSAGFSDFLALELVDGYVSLALNQGSGMVRVACRDQPVSDGQPHNVYLEYHNHRGYLTVDGQKVVFASPSRHDRFDLAGSMSVGGVSKSGDEPPSPDSSTLLGGLLGKGYVGCLQDVVMNGDKVDLATAAQTQGVAGVAEYCQKMEPQCFSHPCMHQGVCIEGWNRFTCDCRATGFIDSVCQTAAATLQFDGTQFVQVTLPEESQTQTEEISLRFRTMRPNGLLFMTTSDLTTDSLELYLEGGVIRLGVSVAGGFKSLSTGRMLNDDRWHTVYIKRRGHQVELRIDVLRPVAENLSGTETFLSIKAFFIGYPSVTKSQPEINRRAAQFDFRHIDIEHALHDDSQRGGQFEGFIGSMQQFIFNDNLFFEMARMGQVENIQLTARLSSEGYLVADPVTFKSMDAFAVLPRLQVHDTFSISFQLKTTESDGLLLYNAGKGQDFLAMELTGGFLYYVYNMGGGTQRIRANVNEKLNDNRWHEIRLLRTERYKQLIRVDDHTPIVDDLSGATAIYFDLQDHLYLGGVKKTMYHTLPKKIEARHGYMGCIGSLDLNKYTPNILREANPVHEAVGDGCQGPSSQCKNDSCANGGRCVQQWTSISCDCDMTSYTGPKCLQESTAYRFGPGSGLITYTYPEDKRPSTTRESLALGFRTTQDDAVLVRIDSASYDDYIEMELTKGKVYVVYNMGTRDYPIGEMFEKLNDNKYHIVRFTRSGPNSTIQVDDLMMQTKMPRGQQAHTFNNQAYVYVGGRKERNGTITRPFQGTVSGLVLNGIRILDETQAGNERVHTDGQVSIVPGLKQPTRPDRRKNGLGKDDTSGMQSTMGIGRDLSRAAIQKFRRHQPSIDSYHSSAKRNNMNTTAAFSTDSVGGTKKHVKRNVPGPRRTRYESVMHARRHKHGQRRRRPSTAHTNNGRGFERDRNTGLSWREPLMDPNTGETLPHNFQKMSKKRDMSFHEVRESEDPGEGREIVEIINIVDTPYPAEPAGRRDGERRRHFPKEVFSEWDDDDDGEIISERRETFSGVTGRDGFPRVASREGFVDIGDGEVMPYDDDDREEKDVATIPRDAETKDLKCTFSDSRGTVVTLKQKADDDDENDDEDNGRDVSEQMEGSGAFGEHPDEELFPEEQFEIISDNDDDDNNTSARLALFSGGDGKDNDVYSENERKVTTVVLPFVAPEGATMSGLLHVTVTGDGKLIDWDHTTTPLNGVTDDIIFSGASPACPYDDDDDCTEVSSGTDDDIFKPTVIVQTTPAPPTTTTNYSDMFRKSSKIIKNGTDCKGSQCRDPGVFSEQTEFFLSTPPDTPTKEQATVKPTQDTGKTVGSDDNGGGINVGLFVGIAISVLVAVVILCVALYKFRRRDEGTYKVDESQNFTSLDSKKTQQGNGTLLAHSGSESGKRGGKKKDVKEWYV